MLRVCWLAVVQKQKKQQILLLFLGRQVGFEPTTHGTTIRYSNQLSYNRHVWCLKKTRQKYTFFEYLQQVLKKKCLEALRGTYSLLQKYLAFLKS